MDQHAGSRYAKSCAMAMIIAARPPRLQLIYLRANVARLLPATKKPDGFSAWFLQSGG